MRDDIKQRKASPDVSFAGLALSATGWIFMMLWLWSVDAGLRAYFLFTLPPTLLAAISLGRFWSRPGETSPRPGLDLLAADAFPAVALLIVGIAFGVLGAGASTTFLALLTGLFVFAPWSRVGFCRHHPVAACLAVCTGAALVAIGKRGDINPVLLPISTWILWTCSAAALFWRAVRALDFTKPHSMT